MTPRRLALLLAAIFVALALPSSVLVYQAYGQLKWEAFYQHQRLARDLARRIDAGFIGLIEREETRAISDYAFLNVTGDGDNAFLQRSPLSSFPPQSPPPGLVGYFQVDAAGRLRTPILPEDRAANYGISADEMRQRERQAGRIRAILDQNRLVSRRDRPAAAALAAPRIEAEGELPREAAEKAADRPEPAPEFSDSVSASSDDDRASEGQAAFDELIARRQSAPADNRSSGAQLETLQIEDSYRVAPGLPPSAGGDAEQKREDRRLRKEKVILPRTLAEAPASEIPDRSEIAYAPTAPAASEKASDEARIAGDVGVPAGAPPGRRAVRIQTFESEVEPMQFAQLDSGHFVLFRRVWRNGDRSVQGILFESGRLVEHLVEAAFRQSTLSSMSRLIVAYQGRVLRDFAADYSRRYQPSAPGASDELLYQSRLAAPFGDLELIFTLARLPLGAGGKIIVWSAIVLSAVLIGGFLLLYQLGLRQLALARQQQDFVSAVSHELKTPLTSIRMYGEMLREGWADENKRKSYYDFIFHEAERLTRLINNVLQLARLSRNEQRASLGEISVADAIAELEPRLRSQLEPSGFELALGGDEAAKSARIRIDSDWFIQIFTNLVDNAVKFSTNTELRRVDLQYRKLRDGRIQFSVRDYGPGVAPDQMKKIFRLFYRSENELTRETVGTGIGLALVRQLASAMAADVDLVNREPGAEFRITVDAR